MNLEKLTQTKVVLFAVGLYLVPTFAFAQNTDPITNLIQSIGEIISMLIPIMAAIVVLVFFYGLAKYVLAAGNEEDQSAGKDIMIRGIIAIFIIAALWGIIELIGEILGIETEGENAIDTIDIQGID